MTAWIGYILVVSVLFTAAAQIGEKAAAALKRPTRWIWAAALLGTLVFAFLRPLVNAPVGGLAGPVVELGLQGGGPSAPVEGAGSGPSVDLALGLFWLFSGVVYWSFLGYTALRLRWWSATWPAQDMDGVPVLLTPNGGPAVLGVFRHRILVPRWLLSWPREERRWVLRHELQHTLARDPLPNALGLLALGTMPWNPMVWWARSNLVRSIEMDCDGRVLQEAGSGGKRYAWLLVEVARNATPIRSPASLAATKSHLHRRVEMALTFQRRPRRALALLLVPAGAAVALASVTINVPQLRTFLGTPTPLEGQEAMPGHLPFTPSSEQVSAALVAHHPRIVAEGLPQDRLVWFVLDERMQVTHTGVGLPEGIRDRIRAEHPGVESDFALTVDYETADWGHRIVTHWIVPPPPADWTPPDGM